MFARDRREITGVRAALTMGLPAAIRKWGEKGKADKKETKPGDGLLLHYCKLDRGNEGEGGYLLISTLLIVGNRQTSTKKRAVKGVYKDMNIR